VEADATGFAAEAPPAEIYRILDGNPTGLRQFIPPKFGIPSLAAMTVKIKLS
jgi:hypothetical protein